jgi:hypothetical protein
MQCISRKMQCISWKCVWKYQVTVGNFFCGSVSHIQETEGIKRKWNREKEEWDRKKERKNERGKKRKRKKRKKEIKENQACRKIRCLNPSCSGVSFVLTSYLTDFLAFLLWVLFFYINFFNNTFVVRQFIIINVFFYEESITLHGNRALYRIT